MHDMKCITLGITQEVLDLLNKNKIEFSVEPHIRQPWHYHLIKKNPIKVGGFGTFEPTKVYEGNPYSICRNSAGETNG